LADQIIILGDSTIQLRGTADEVLHSSSQVLKTIFNEKEPTFDRLKETPDIQHLAQSTSTDAAALNWTRRTGDLAVYGMNALLSLDPKAYVLQLIISRPLVL
jgi:hypothetical protein